MVEDVKKFAILKKVTKFHDYVEKLKFYNKRRDMINYLNKKYTTATKLFMEILDKFYKNPTKIQSDPSDLVKQCLRTVVDSAHK